MDDYVTQEDPLVAAGHLAVAIKRGTFVLLLGAGVSKGVGLPDWSELVQHCCAITGAAFDPHELTGAMDDAYEHGAGLDPPLTRDEIVRTALYAELESSDGYQVEELRAPLLIGLGSLVMSGARNGSTEVFTLNFDDVLESYLVAHGFAVQVITGDAFDVRGDVDVHIYHPHGYLPFGRKRASPDLVLSQDEFIERLSDNPEQPWPASFLSHLHGRVAIAIGLSFSDENLLQLCRRANKYLNRPLGYSLNVHTEKQVKLLRRNGIIPVSFGSHDEIPDYLLKLARQTARVINL